MLYNSKSMVKHSRALAICNLDIIWSGSIFAIRPGGLV